MRKYLLAATAAAIAAPAFAAANGPYVGIEGGVVFPRSTDLDVILNNTTATPPTTATYNNGLNVDYKTGWGVDAIAGYKLGLLRIEAEGGYQRAPIKGVKGSTALLTDAGTASGTSVTGDNFVTGDKMGVTTLMANALLDSDFGDSRFGGYIGGGAGRAWTSFSGDKDNAWAYQGIAGLRYAATDNVDVGLKYRYLRTGSLQYDDSFTTNGTTFDTTSKGHYSSNSILASLVYNFNSRAAPAPVPAAAPAPPPPPPPEAPATQTCPDGSVILATSACPAPPPPPPPPPAAKGERG
jgi:opacity protein-like surface antigen